MKSIVLFLALLQVSALTCIAQNKQSMPIKAGAALGPLAMGGVSDLFGSNAYYGFILATVFAAILFVGALLNMIFNPTKSRLQSLDESEYDIHTTEKN